MEKLLNGENYWDQVTTCVQKKGPMCRIAAHEVSIANSIRKQVGRGG